jgi:hypothetical protein
MGVFPHVYTLLFRHLGPLIKLCVAAKAQGCYPVVVGFESPPLSVTQLIGVGGDHCSIAYPAVLARTIPHGF